MSLNEFQDDLSKILNPEQSLVPINSNSGEIQKGIVRMELNFLKLPIFTMDKKRVGKRESLSLVLAPKVIDGVKRQVRLAVSPPVDYGLGGPFDYAAFRAVEYILSGIYAEKGSLTNPIGIGSMYRVLQVMGVILDGKNYDDLAKFFKRLRGTTLNIDYSVYDKVKKRWYESLDGDFIYKRVVLTGEDLPDAGGKADQIYIWLSDFYLSNLNASFVKLVDYAFYQSLELPTTRRFYEILSVYAYKYSAVRLNYSELCLRVPMTRWESLSQAKQKMSSPLQELINKGLLHSYEFIPIVTQKDESEEGNKKEKKDEKSDWKDWQVKFVFGKAKSLFQSQFELSQEGEFDGSSEISVFEDKKKLPGKEPSNASIFLSTYKRMLAEIRGVNAFIEYSRDTKIVNDLLEAYGMKKLERLLKRFLKTEDPYLMNKGYTLIQFRKMINTFAIADKEAQDYTGVCEELLSYLKAKTGKDFTGQIDETLQLVSGWMRKGKTTDDFKKVIDNMVSAWKDDPKMCNFIRPSTLFGKKMDNYINFKANGNGNGRKSSSDYIPGKYVGIGTIVNLDEPDPDDSGKDAE